MQKYFELPTHARQSFSRPGGEGVASNLSRDVQLEVSRKKLGHKGPGENIIVCARYGEDERPSRYDIRIVKAWRHIDQATDGAVAVRTAYDYLKKNKLLPFFLNLQDGYAISKKSPIVYRRWFGEDNKVLLWGSAEDARGVPYLYVSHTKIKMGWYPMSVTIFFFSPGLRFE